MVVTVLGAAGNIDKQNPITARFLRGLDGSAERAVLVRPCKRGVAENQLAVLHSEVLAVFAGLLDAPAAFNLCKGELALIFTTEIEAILLAVFKLCDFLLIGAYSTSSVYSL